MTAPYVDLMNPDWAVRAALAVAADLCDRHGIQDEMQRLDRAMRHEMIVHQAHLIRSIWARELQPQMDRAMATVVAELDADLRGRLEAAVDFSRAVHALRPDCWHVAMIDAYGPGDHRPPPPKASRR